MGKYIGYKPSCEWSRLLSPALFLLFTQLVVEAMSCSRLVLVGLGFAVAMTGLGCGKSCVDVLKDLAEAGAKCPAMLTGDEAKRCTCWTDAVKIALDEDACEGVQKTSIDAFKTAGCLKNVVVPVAPAQLE